jgi:hypothetical protein
MTEKDLYQYKALIKRIECNEKRLEEWRTKDIPVVSGNVKGSSKNFPYIQTHYHIEMYEPYEAEKKNSRIHELERCIQADRNKIKCIVDFIDSIDDPELQSIFEMRVYDKMGWIEIATELDEDKDRTTYSKKFKIYIENSHNSPISQ